MIDVRPTDPDLAERYAKLTPYEAYQLARKKMEEVPNFSTDMAGLSSYIEEEVWIIQRQCDEICALLRRKGQQQ